MLWVGIILANEVILFTFPRCSTICAYPRSVIWRFSLASIQLSPSSGVYTAEPKKNKNGLESYSFLVSFKVREKYSAEKLSVLKTETKYVDLSVLRLGFL